MDVIFPQRVIDFSFLVDHTTHYAEYQDEVHPHGVQLIPPHNYVAYRIMKEVYLFSQARRDGEKIIPEANRTQIFVEYLLFEVIVDVILEEALENSHFAEMLCNIMHTESPNDQDLKRRAQTGEYYKVDQMLKSRSLSENFGPARKRFESLCYNYSGYSNERLSVK